MAPTVVCVDEPLGSFFGESRSRFRPNFQLFPHFCHFSLPYRVLSLQILLLPSLQHEPTTFIVLLFSRLRLTLFHSILSFLLYFATFVIESMTELLNKAAKALNIADDSKRISPL